MSPSIARALRSWAHAGVRVPVELGAAMLVAPFSREGSRAIQRHCSAAIARELGLSIAVDDRSGVANPDRGVLYVHLHQQTLLEVLLYPLALPPFTLIMNVEFAMLPLFGWLPMVRGGVAIVRQRPAQAKAALRRVASRLRGGESFAMSIEGRRSEDGGLSPFKKGAAVLAIDAQCDVVPFMTHGEYALWPRGEWCIRPGHVEVVLYPAISTAGLRYADRDALTAELRALAEREISARR